MYIALPAAMDEAFEDEYSPRRRSMQGSMACVHFTENRRGV